MRFDEALHDQTPEGFVQKERQIPDFKSANTPAAYTRYEPKSDFSFDVYGLQLSSASAMLKTTYHRKKGMFAKKSIEDQIAKFDLFFDATYEGYERGPDWGIERTVGDSQDPDKERVVAAMVAGLQKRFPDCKVAMETGRSNITIIPPDFSANSLEDFTRIKNTLQQIAQEYTDGKKPLGDIKEPERKTKVNPRHRPVVLPDVVGVDGPLPPGIIQKKRSPKNRLTPLLDIARAAFPEGETVTPENHEQFETQLREWLDRGRGGRGLD